MTPNSSYIHFKENVAKALQAAPYGWAGRAGYELAEKYSDVIECFWPNNAPVDAVAEFIHVRYMEREQAHTGFPTRLELEAVGCEYHYVREEA